MVPNNTQMAFTAIYPQRFRVQISESLLLPDYAGIGSPLHHVCLLKCHVCYVLCVVSDKMSYLCLANISTSFSSRFFTQMHECAWQVLQLTNVTSDFVYRNAEPLSINWV